MEGIFTLESSLKIVIEEALFSLFDHSIDRFEKFRIRKLVMKIILNETIVQKLSAVLFIYKSSICRVSVACGTDHDYADAISTARSVKVGYIKIGIRQFTKR